MTVHPPIIDDNLQLLPAVTHVQSDGSNIGGVDPASYGYQIVPGVRKQSLLMYTSGTSKSGGYPAWLWSTHPRAMLSTSGAFALSYRAIFGGSLSGMNVFETDTILVAQCHDGQTRKFNLSLQRHAATGQIDIGNWTSTGLMTGALQLNTIYDVEIMYAYDLTANICSVLSYTCNGQTYTVPPGMLNMPATICNWSKGAIPQIQQGSVQSAQPWNVKISRMRYWWY